MISPSGAIDGIKNFFVGCGMNSVGIASAAGVGRALAQWIDQGYPEETLWPVDIRRYFSWQQNASYLHDKYLVQGPDKDVISDQWILDGHYEIMVEGRKIPAKVHLRSPYDPNNKRPKM